MVRIAPVNLPYNPKTLWFDAGELELHAGCDVVVQTARGTEFGHMPEPAFEATSDQVKKLKTPLKPVLRVADDEDRAKQAELEARAAEALPVFKELAAKASEEMRPVSVEYLFDGDKAVFYFESENRVDFRELVRTLSSRLHVRVDMRQIGVRDEARMVGGLGHCGQELCCKRLGGEFCPVSIRMAKEQDLSLNPQKISGVCGRLMCCLRYEYDAYKDFKSRAPKKNAQVETPDGAAKVVDLDVPREVVSLRIEGEKPVRVPLADFDAPEEGARPKCVGCEAWERALSEQPGDAFGAAAALATPQLSGKDKLAERASVRHVPGSKKADGAGEAKPGRSSRRGRGKGEHAEQKAAADRSLRASRVVAAPPRCRAALRRVGRTRLRASIPPRRPTRRPRASNPTRAASSPRKARPSVAACSRASAAARAARTPSSRTGAGRQAILAPLNRRASAVRAPKGGSDAQRGGKPDNQGPKAPCPPGSEVLGPGAGPPSRPGWPAQAARGRSGGSGSRSASPRPSPQPQSRRRRRGPGLRAR